MNVIATRIREARTNVGLSQEQLGIAIGIDEATASTRMNRYERGLRTPTLALLEKLGEILNLPATYFYAKDEMEAELLVSFHRLAAPEKAELLNNARRLVSDR